MGAFTNGTVLTDNNTVAECLDTLDVATTRLQLTLGSSNPSDMGAFASKTHALGFELEGDKTAHYLMQTIANRVDAESKLTDNLQSLIGTTTNAQGEGQPYSNDVVHLGSFTPANPTPTFALNPNLTIKQAIQDLADAIDVMNTTSFALGTDGNTWTAQGNMAVSKQISVGSASVGDPYVLVGNGDLQVSNAITTKTLTSSEGIVARWCVAAGHRRGQAKPYGREHRERGHSACRDRSLSASPLGLGADFHTLHVNPSSVSEASSGTHALAAGEILLLPCRVGWCDDLRSSHCSDCGQHHGRRSEELRTPREGIGSGKPIRRKSGHFWRDT